MDTTPEEEEEANSLVIAFKKLNTQLVLLDERDRRAEAREREAQEREQTLIERQSKLNEAMNNIVIKSGNFHRSIVDVETRTKTYLEGYFKELPKSATVVQRKEWGFDSDAKTLFFIIAFATLFAAVGSYYFTSLSYIETVSNQRKLIREYEGNIEYLKSKIPAEPAKKKKRRNN
jgi:hypothetical protein